jgi:transposase
MIVLKSIEMSQNEYEFISIDELVPENHLLRLIDKHIDHSFILEKTQSYYSEYNGRPTDPLIFFKMMFIVYIYGFRSDRKLEQEIKMNVAYRWFLGLKFCDPIPHHSTICWNRQHRRTRFS